MRFRLRSQTQTIVVRWLVGVWLFAVVQSLAHACVLQQRHAHLNATAVAADASNASNASNRSDHEHDHRGATDDVDVSDVLCLRTCDDAESGVWAASTNWVPDLALMTPLVFRPWSDLSPPVGSDQVEGPSPPGGPPPAIRFLRLNR